MVEAAEKDWRSVDADALFAAKNGLDRASVRQCFERRFSDERMARDYLAIYRQLTGTEAARLLPVATGSEGRLIGAVA